MQTHFRCVCVQEREEQFALAIRSGGSRFPLSIVASVLGFEGETPRAVAVRLIPSTEQLRGQLLRLPPGLRQVLGERAATVVGRHGLDTTGPIRPDPDNPLRWVIGASTVTEAARVLHAGERLSWLSGLLSDDARSSFLRRLRRICNEGREQLYRPPSSATSLDFELYQLARDFLLVPFVGAMPDVAPLIVRPD